jgi:phosphoglycolate phosphatase
MSQAPIRAVLFDLDGTLVDTAPDMAAALNLLLEEQGASPLPYQNIRPVVSNGAAALVTLGFGADLEAKRETELRQRYLEIYQEALCNESRLFSGYNEVLEHIELRRIIWGIVTNKPAWLTTPLLDELRLNDRAACIVSGDTVDQRKPHPMPLLHAAKLISVSVENCVYVGDAVRDVQAAHAAGMRSLVASYGYIPDNEQPDTWSADGYIEHPSDLPGWIDAYNGSE